MIKVRATVVQKKMLFW